MHHNAFWLGAMLFVVTLVLSFIQWYLGDEEDAAIRDRLLSWYNSIKGGDWSSLFVSAASTTERFLSYLFGHKIMSLRYFAIAIPFAILVNFVTFETATFAHRALMTLRNPKIADVVVAAVISNVILDVMILAVMRQYFRVIARRSRPRIFLDILTIVGVAYIACGLSLAISGSFLWGLNNNQVGLEVRLMLILSTALFWGLGPLWLLIQDHGSLFITVGGLFQAMTLGLPAIFSSLLYLLVYVVSTILYYTRPITQRPLANVLERLSKSKKGVLPTISGGLSALSSAIAYFTSS